MGMTFSRANIFDPELCVECLVNPVNTMGICGAGLAKQFAKYYPVDCEQYRQYCKEGKLLVGGVYTTRQQDGHLIMHAATKDKYWEKSSTFIIKTVIPNICEEMERLDITSIAIPALGCGLGGLRDVEVHKLFFDLISVEFSRRKRIILLDAYNTN